METLLKLYFGIGTICALFETINFLAWQRKNEPDESRGFVAVFCGILFGVLLLCWPLQLYLRIVAWRASK